MTTNVPNEGAGLAALMLSVNTLVALRAQGFLSADEAAGLVTQAQETLKAVGGPGTEAARMVLAVVKQELSGTVGDGA